MTYTDVFNIDKPVCPYCRRVHTPGPMTPNRRHELECGECGHKFYGKRGVRTEHTSGAYHTAPCCELNGYPHDMITKTSMGNSYTFCSICDKEY